MLSNKHADASRERTLNLWRLDGPQVPLMDETISPELPPDRVVAFVDILGFRELVKSIFGPPPNSDRFARVLRGLRLVRGHANIASEQVFLSVPTSRGAAFSDCLVISDEPTNIGITNVAWRVALLASWLLREKILCRGGIAIGPFLHEEGLLFGPALIEAHELESRAAIYPRIILSDAVAKLAGQWPPLARARQDVDGFFFVDPFYHLRLPPEQPLPQSLREPLKWDRIQLRDAAVHLAEQVNVLRSHLDSRARSVRSSWACKYGGGGLQGGPGKTDFHPS